MAIKLSEIISIKPEDYGDWTFCLNNANAEGIYSFESDRNRLLEHISWHKTKGNKMAFRSIYTKYCLQFIRLDKDGKWNQWLFLGAFENHGLKTTEYGHEVYDLKPIDRFSSFRDKLVIHYQKKQGPKQAKIDMSNIEEVEVVKILEKPYIKTDKQFDGYDKIRLDFKELKNLINSNVDNWRELLSNVNGIYVITDKSNGKLYVGSTYGKEGVWQRWSAYVGTNGHGNDVELKKLLENDPEYAVKNFQFSILEIFLNSDSNDQHILDREDYWKKVLYSKERGYNHN